MTATLPTGSQERKDIPLVRGLLDYFPAALAAVAEVSRAGNEKHNPGEEMHHARGKSMDHADCIARHLVDRGTVDPEDGLRHAAKVAWRALALLQEELEAAGAPLPRGARLPAAEAVLGETVADIKKKIAETGDTPAFGVETDPRGRKYRRTGERRPTQNGEYYIAESKGFLGQVQRESLGQSAADYTIVTLVEDPPEGVLPRGWEIGSVVSICGYDGDTNAGDWRIVDYRLPKQGELYAYLDPDSESGRPTVQRATLDHTLARGCRQAIVERVEATDEIHTDPTGQRYKIRCRRDVSRGDCYLSENPLVLNEVVGPAGYDEPYRRTIVERVG